MWREHSTSKAGCAPQAQPGLPLPSPPPPPRPGAPPGPTHNPLHPSRAYTPPPPSLPKPYCVPQTLSPPPPNSSGPHYSQLHLSSPRPCWDTKVSLRTSYPPAPAQTSPGGLCMALPTHTPTPEAVLPTCTQPGLQCRAGMTPNSNTELYPKGHNPPPTHLGPLRGASYPPDSTRPRPEGLPVAHSTPQGPTHSHSISLTS